MAIISAGDDDGHDETGGIRWPLYIEYRSLGPDLT